jgi:outer membrane protein insertion porin family
MRRLFSDLIPKVVRQRLGSVPREGEAPAEPGISARYYFTVARPEPRPPKALRPLRGRRFAQSIVVTLCSAGVTISALAQTAVQAPRLEEKQKVKHAVAKQQEKRAQGANIEFRGAVAFSEKELRSQLKEQLSTVEDLGLTAARGDDVAFFLELFYRKHGYAKVTVRYAIGAGNQLRLDINEGPLTILAAVTFEGNTKLPAEKLFEYAVGPTRERYSKAQKNLPFVASDIEEGADLVHRLYIAVGFVDAIVDPPRYSYLDNGSRVNVTISIHEGRQYFFGAVSFSGQTIYGPEALRGQMLDLLSQPYTDARVADIPRRLQTYFKARGYYDVKIETSGDPAVAENGHVPVHVTIVPGPLYRFDGVTVHGLDRLHPSYVTGRFRRLNGKIYSPEVIDERFRELMRSGLFNILQIKPTPIGGNLLRLDISAEEAKSKEFGFSIGYGSYPGAIVGVQYRDRDMFGYGRPITTSIEISQRSYKGEILYEDPYLFETDLNLRARLSALTFDFDGYSKFEIGTKIELTRKITKQYQLGLVYSARHVEVTSADIEPDFLGRTSYFVSSLGFTQTLDLRESPFVAPRGLVFDNTLDVAASALGSQVDFVRSTVRVSYYLPFAGKKVQTPGVGEELLAPSGRRWIERTSLALGARAGIIHSLTKSGAGEEFDIPIDERFFNGGSTTVRSFTERDLGPHDFDGHPIGGEFFTIMNAEYTFPLYGELLGALFVDAGNLLPSAEDPGFNDLRYAIGLGLRYQLPIGPIRLDYGVNPDPRVNEDAGAFHVSFGFAF